MYKIVNPLEYAHLFEKYDHHRAVIYSSLEGQYPCSLHVDNISEPQCAILFTQFDYHFVTGIPGRDIISTLREMIFEVFISKEKPEELLMFGPDKQWEKILNQVFEGYSDIKDPRYSFKLNMNTFIDVRESFALPKGIEYSISSETDNGSNFPYSVCTLFKEKVQIAKCEGFMIGNNHVEINVNVIEKYRGKGYGKMASILLISDILDKGLLPDWTCWGENKASVSLAQAIGFKKSKESTAFIWVKDED